MDGEDEFTIVRAEEVDFSLGRISMDSPLGVAILGRNIGERVKVRAPGGVRAVAILDVE
jgi:transcription elongation GreA/GreB family factor